MNRERERSYLIGRGELGDVVDDRGEVGGSEQLDPVDRVKVGTHYTLKIIKES